MADNKVIEAILKSEHPVYAEFGQDGGLWEINERRLFGDADIYDEIVPFQYEDEDDDHHTARKNAANYVPLPARMATKYVGALSKEAPTPESGWAAGQLGEVDLEQTVPSEATMIWTNADGQGEEGSDWTSFWDRVMFNAMATGHRWVFANMPAGASTAMGRQAEVEGQRPHLIEYSPRQVPDWHYDSGRLAYILIRYSDRTPRITDDGEFTSDEEEVYLLMVRTGYEGLGSDYSAGGWWKYDKEGTLLKDANGVDQTGTWDATEGQIPMVPCFYKKDRRNFSQPGITEIGRIAVSMMNLESAGDNDAIEGGSRRLYLLGVDPDEHDAVVDQHNFGFRVVGVPAGGIDGEKIPNVYDSAEASANAAIESRLKHKESMAGKIAQDELKAGEDASGVSRQSDFLDVKAPTLSMMARNREAAENPSLRFLAMLWGKSSDGIIITWPKQFDITPVSDDWGQVYDQLVITGAKSPTLVARGFVSTLSELGLVVEETDLTTIENEIIQSLQAAEQQSAQNAALDAELGLQ